MNHVSEDQYFFDPSYEESEWFVMAEVVKEHLFEFIKSFL